MRAAAGDLHLEFDRIESALGDGDWLVDDKVSAADIVAHTYLEFLLRIAGRDEVRQLDLELNDMANRYPGISGWREAATGLNGYDRAYPPHWRTG